MRRDRIVMVRCPTPKRVTLPNGRKFTTRFKRGLEEIYQQIFTLKDRTNKEQLLKEKDEDNCIKVVVVLKVHLANCLK